MAASYAFTTPRLVLEVLSLEKHLEDFHELWTSPEAVKWSTRGPKRTIEESKEWMVDFILPTEANNEVDKYALVLRNVPENHALLQSPALSLRPGGDVLLNERGTPKMIGMVGTNRWSDEGMETGYCLNMKYWGNGFATEAMKGFLELYWGLEERNGIKKLVAKTHPEHVVSQRVIVKCGGVQGETLEKSYARWGDEGVKSDTICYYFWRPGVDRSAEEIKTEKKSVDTTTA